MAIKRRLSVFKFWLKGRRNGASFLDLLAKTFEPVCKIKAKQKIKNIELAGL